MNSCVSTVSSLLFLSGSEHRFRLNGEVKYILRNAIGKCIITGRENTIGKRGGGRVM